MLQYEKHYSLGARTLTYMWIIYGWWMTLIGMLIIYLSFLMWFGSMYESTTHYLDTHPDLFLDTYTVALVTFMTGISVIFVGFLRSFVMFKQYKFTVDKKAFHLRRGIFKIREIRVPYIQISSVNMEQPYFFRLLGLARLDVLMNVDTGVARTIANHKKREDQLFLIPLIDKKRAHQLSNHLMKHSTGELDADDMVEDDPEEYEYVEVDDSYILKDGEYEIGFTDEEDAPEAPQKK